MRRLMVTLGLAILSLLLLRGGAVVHAQDTCVHLCREELETCLFDSRDERDLCLDKAACNDLRHAYRTACHDQGRQAPECRKARKAFRSCVTPCRQMFREAVGHCRDAFGDCLSEDCNIQRPDRDRPRPKSPHRRHPHCDR